MKVVCAWCETVVREAPEPALTSHGICDECSYTVLNETGVGLRRLLKGTKVPVVIVNADRDIQAESCGVNDKIGRVIHCARANCGAGCGRSSQCGPCSLREAITKTYEDGEARYGAVSEHPLKSSTNRILHLQFSTQKLGGDVLVVFERRYWALR